ncbi:MAG: glycerophosphodiester phosphodiesterase family protein [Anaerolineales bacterium]|nr:glycerophosphodiester phosphodiesterase family protein [Anaerolineales bacterium]
MLEKLPQPAVIAHRGSSAYAPENTLDAFNLAIEQKADAVELDVRITADHQLVVFHDHSVDRITSGSGQIHKLTYQDLAVLEFSSPYGKMFPDARIPLLEDVLASIGNKIPINIELKTSPAFSTALSRLTANCLKDFLPGPKLILSSFNSFVLHQIHHLIPDLDLGLLIRRGSYPFWKHTGGLRLLPIKSLHVPCDDLSPSRIAAVQDLGLKTFAYTVDHPQIIADLTTANIDGIITNDPPLARRTIDQICNS